MERVQKFRRWSAVLLSAVGLTFGYEARNLSQAGGFDKSLLLIVCVALGTAAAASLTDLLMRLRFVRRLILGPVWLEGVWLVDVFEGDRLVRTEVSQFSYQGPELALTVTNSDPRGQSSDGVFYTVSQTASVRETDLSYTNYFVSSYANDVLGVAIGNFYRDRSVPYPIRYEGKTFYLNGASPKREMAVKVGEVEFRRLVAKYGVMWQENIVEELRGRRDAGRGGAALPRPDPPALDGVAAGGPHRDARADGEEIEPRGRAIDG